MCVHLPSACPTAASPFWFILFFLLFFFLSLMGDDWPGSFPEKGLAAPSSASDIWCKNNEQYVYDSSVCSLSGVQYFLWMAPAYIPTLCALVDNEDGQRWSPRSPPWGDKPAARSSTTERVDGHNRGTDRRQEVTWHYVSMMRRKSSD